jgi:predicted aspartyl protease
MKLSMLSLAAAACATVPTTPAARRAMVADDAAALLDAWATAVGGRDRVARIDAVAMSGALEAGGLTGSFTTWETARGERRHEESLSAIGSTVEVFDGARAWRVDLNRNVRALDGVDLEDQIALAYLGANAPVVLARRPGRVSRDGDRLRLEPEGGRALTVAFDPATHLPATIERRAAEKTQVTSLSDWREVGGVSFPFTIRIDDGDPRDARTFHVDSVGIDRAVPAGAFARPADSPPDYQFAAGGTATMPIDLSTTLVFVEARVNGSPPLAFILDTGAEVSVINRSRLARLGLEAVGDFATGAGGGNVAMAYVKGVSFALPGVRLNDQTVTAMPLDALEVPLGHPIDGILGYDFLSRFVVEIDYPKSTLRLYDHAAGHRAGGQPIPVTIDGAVLNVAATVDVAGRAVASRFIVDTGCNCEVAANAPFTRAHRLIEASPKLLSPPSGSRGAGGETSAVMGRVAGLAIGDVQLKSVIALFGRDSVGALADSDSAGQIGGGLLRRFVVTFDYRGKTMWLDKTPGFDRPTRIVSAGIRWAPDAAGLAVQAILDGSPGAEAGLAVGDVLVSVNGTPAAGYTTAMLDTLFHQDGARHAVVVSRGSRQLAVTVTPRDLL